MFISQRKGNQRFKVSTNCNHLLVVSSRLKTIEELVAIQKPLQFIQIAEDLMLETDKVQISLVSPTYKKIQEYQQNAEMKIILLPQTMEIL